MKRKIVLEWDDNPKLLATDNYQLEVIAVSPFKKPDRFGWILTFRVVGKPERTVQDWLTVQTDNKKYAWLVEKTQKFLQFAGLAGTQSDPTEVTHKDLIGIVITARVEKTINKKTSEYINRVKAYLGAEEGLEDQF